MRYGTRYQFSDSDLVHDPQGSDEHSLRAPGTEGDRRYPMVSDQSVAQQKAGQDGT